MLQPRSLVLKVLRTELQGSASYLFTFVFIFRNLLWGSVNNGQPLHGLHNTKRLRTIGLDDRADFSTVCHMLNLIFMDKIGNSFKFFANNACRPVVLIYEMELSDLSYSLNNFSGSCIGCWTKRNLKTYKSDNGYFCLCIYEYLIGIESLLTEEQMVFSSHFS